MRTVLAAMTFLGVAGAAVSATATQYSLSFTVQVDDASPVALNASVPLGNSRTLQAF